jgi:hypothetical protein
VYTEANARSEQHLAVTHTEKIYPPHKNVTTAGNNQNSKTRHKGKKPAHQKT